MEPQTTLADGRFSLTALLGEGGMARVYRAYDHRLKRWRAVKVLLPEYAKRAKIRQRFETEAQALALLEHQNIVRIYDVGGSAENSWIVMELCEGGSVEDWLVEFGPMPPRLAVRLLLAVCDGLEVAHREGILHRDIKPHNLLIGRKGTPKITDFGIAHVESAQLTRTGAAMGTDGYMAPEQREDAKNVGPACDIYSMGATLYTLVTGRTDPHLFAADHDPSKLEAVPAPLRPAIARCTAYRPEDRFASATALRQALVATLPALSPDPPETAPLAWRTAAPQDPPQPPPTLVPGTSPSVGDAGATMWQGSAPEGTLDPDPRAAPRPTLLPAEGELDELVAGFDAPPTAPEPLAAVERTVPERAPNQTLGMSHGGFQVVYEEPVDRADDDKWTNTMVGWKPPPKREGGEGRPGEADESPVEQDLTGFAWAAGEAWGFITQVLTTALKAVGNPAGFAIPGVMAIGVLLAIAALINALRGAAMLDGVAMAYESQVASFHQAVASDRGLPDALVEVGGNEELIREAVRRYEAAAEPEERQRAAERLAALLAAELAVLETSGRLDLPQQRALRRRVAAIQSERRALDAAEEAWREAAKTSAGQWAIRLRRAAPPPED